jgi:hypothetical protein
MAGARKSTARRYAEAIYEIAQRDGNVETWLEQLQTVGEAVSDDAVVRGLEDPNVPIERRMAALERRSGRHGSADAQPDGAHRPSPAPRDAAADRSRVPAAVQRPSRHRRGNGRHCRAARRREVAALEAASSR